MFFLWWIINHFAIFSQKSQCHKFWAGMRRNWKFLVGYWRFSYNYAQIWTFRCFIVWTTMANKRTKRSKKVSNPCLCPFAPWTMSLWPMFSSYFRGSVLLLFENFLHSVDVLIVVVCSHVSNDWVCLLFFSLFSSADFEHVISHHIQHDDFLAALDVLTKQVTIMQSLCHFHSISIARRGSLDPSCFSTPWTEPP